MFIYILRNVKQTPYSWCLRVQLYPFPLVLLGRRAYAPTTLLPPLKPWIVYSKLRKLRWTRLEVAVQEPVIVICQEAHTFRRSNE